MQFHIKLPDQSSLVVDASDDESFSVHVDSFPKNSEWDKSLLNVKGLRWRDEKHYHLEWLENYELDVGDVVTVEVVDANEQISPPKKVQEYVEPEKHCGFCEKRASEVEILIVRNPEYQLSGICNECVEACTREIEARRSRN